MCAAQKDKKSASHQKFPPFIAPSILSANWSCLEAEIKSVVQGGADWLHLDVMDGHFVPSLTFGPALVEAIRPHSPVPLDCHLMVSKPEEWIKPFAQAGVDLISFHLEATAHAHRCIQEIHAMNKKAGIAINPATPVQWIEPLIDEIDLLLIMTVNPGWGGQQMIDSCVKKVQQAHQMRGERHFRIEVDGGVHEKTISTLSRAGADTFVAGSAIFKTTDRKQKIQQLKAQI